MKKALIIFCFLTSCENTEKLEKSATDFTNKLGYQVKGVSCTSYDTDRDGYVSCSVSTNSGEILQIECASTYSMFNSGCRQTKLGTVINTVNKYIKKR